MEDFGETDPFLKFLDSSIEWEDSIVRKELVGNSSTPSKTEQNNVIVISDEDSPMKLQKRIIQNRVNDLQRKNELLLLEKRELEKGLDIIIKELDQIKNIL
ncbi:uncharacterized protein LOC117315469 [Pecten maximus]|uniref:uncharacterized protein LOC117315469 n=1 Tax=Pecten maximus TaxID=6579 RepID=UPI0014581F0E|nr:uncharacterized protein LOC117315469 [Pecten maximus]